MTEDYIQIQECRICGSTQLFEFLDLGSVPPVNHFSDQPNTEQESFPLKTVFCENCNHVQLRNTVDRDLLFENYAYFSSASDPLLEHFGQYAEMVETTLLNEGDLVVEIGCNDGILLRQLSDVYNKVGIEPAENIAATARRDYGLEIISDFFDVDVSNTIVSSHGQAELILANNVIGHIDDLHQLMTGIDKLLSDNGVFVMEVPYLVDLLNHNEFDTIYHEHISYFAIRPLIHLFSQYGLELYDVTRLSIHGGSIRVFVQRADGPHDRTVFVDDLVTLEEEVGLNNKSTFERFEKMVERNRDQLTGLLERLKDETIVGYGAPAKGNVLLNYCDIGSETIDYIIDTTPEKQGTYAPGTNIPVRKPEKFREDDPAYALLLAWNYRDEILEKEADYRDRGGRFIIPQPYVDIV